MITLKLDLKLCIKQNRTWLVQRLPIVPAKVKAGNNAEDLLNGIRQIVYSLSISHKKLPKKNMMT